MESNELKIGCLARTMRIATFYHDPKAFARRIATRDLTKVRDIEILEQNALVVLLEIAEKSYKILYGDRVGYVTCDLKRVQDER